MEATFVGRPADVMFVNNNNNKQKDKTAFCS